MNIDHDFNQKKIVFKNKNFNISIVILLYVLFVSKLSYLLIDYRSVDIYDEVTFLRVGSVFNIKSIMNWFLHENDWSPFYVLWYKLLSFFESDPLLRYKLNQFLIFTLLPLSFSAFLYRSGVNGLLAIILGLIFLFDPHAALITRLPNHFALVWCFSLLSLFLGFKDFDVKLFWSFLVLLSASYIRGEYILGATLFFVFSVCRNVFLKKVVDKRLAISAIVFITVFTHFKSIEAKKPIDTFYAKNQERLTFQKREQVSREDAARMYSFKKKLLDACITNISLCTDHLFFNVRTYSSHIVFAFINLLIVFCFNYYIFLVLIFLAIIFLCQDKNKKSYNKLFCYFDKLNKTGTDRFLILTLGAVLFPTLVTVNFFGPLFQYEVGHLVIYCSIFLFLIKKTFPVPSYKVSITILLFFIVSPWELPLDKTFKGLTFGHIDLEQRELNTVLSLRKLESESRVKLNILSEGEFAAFLPRKPLANVTLWNAGIEVSKDALDDIVRDNDINTVVLNCVWKCEDRKAENALIDYGFVKLKKYKTSFPVFVRKDLIRVDESRGLFP